MSEKLIGVTAMALAASKRSVMTLYAAQNSLLCHQTCIVLNEKGVPFEFVEVMPGTNPKDFLSANPHGTTPTLVDRDLVLNDPHIIMEYLDERFPHPPLLPVYPVARAKSRLMISRIEREWHVLIDQMEKGNPEMAKQARKLLQEQIIEVAPLFSKNMYCLSEEFSLIDCCLAPILWRLSQLKIELPPKAKDVKDYAQRLFKRASIKSSLSEISPTKN